MLSCPCHQCVAGEGCAFGYLKNERCGALEIDVHQQVYGGLRKRIARDGLFKQSDGFVGQSEFHDGGSVGGSIGIVGIGMVKHGPEHFRYLFALMVETVHQASLKT